MTDLDDRFDRLRADLTSRIVVPPWPSILAGPAVPHRRRLSAALVAAALVIAVLTTGALLAKSSRNPNTTPAAPHPASSTTQKITAVTPPTPAPVSTPAASTPVPVWSRSIWSASMADSRHGFVLIQTCNADNSTCRSEISVTQDGTHWVRRAAPSNTSSQDSVTGGVDAPSLTALGPRTVFYQAAPAGAHSGFVSLDAGVTWRSVPPGVNGTVDRIPTGGCCRRCVRRADPIRVSPLE